MQCDDQHSLPDKEDTHQETSHQSQNDDVKNKNEKLDNEAIFREELTNNELIDTDSESTFTDLDLDREDFTDDSDYGMPIVKMYCLYCKYVEKLFRKMLRIYRNAFKSKEVRTLVIN